MDLVREITVKHFDKFTDRLVSDMCNTPYCARLGGNEGSAKKIYVCISLQCVYVTVQGGVNCE